MRMYKGSIHYVHIIQYSIYMQVYSTNGIYVYLRGSIYIHKIILMYITQVHVYVSEYVCMFYVHVYVATSGGKGIRLCLGQGRVGEGGAFIIMSSYFMSLLLCYH